jgi:hypothetical protein
MHYKKRSFFKNGLDPYFIKREIEFSVYKSANCQSDCKTQAARTSIGVDWLKRTKTILYYTAIGRTTNGLLRNPARLE